MDWRFASGDFNAMMTFDKRILELESEIEALKTAAYFGTAVVSATTKTVQTQIEMYYYTTGIGGANEYCSSKYNPIIEVIPEGNANCICSIGVSSGQSNIKGRACRLVRFAKNGHPAYFFQVIEGSPQDFNTCKNGGTVKFNITFQITCTSNFTTNLTYLEDSQ